MKKHKEKMQKFLNILYVFFIFYILFFISPKIIQGQQLSLSLSPPLLKIFIKPGKSIMVAYKFENNADPGIFSAKVLPFEPAGNTGNIRLKQEFEGPIRFSLDNSDISLNQPFFMKTRDQTQLLLRIRVPEGAPEGDYYYTLLVESQPPPAVDGSVSTGTKATIGSNILITVTKTGKVDIKGKIALFDVLPRFKLRLFDKIFNFFDSNDKIPIVLIVENKGKNVITPEGEIIMRGNFGEKAKYEVIPQNILAESQRLITASNSAEIDCETNKKLCSTPISLIISGFFVGVYKLSATLNFGENSPNVYASTSFIALPLKIIAGLIITLIIAVFIIKKINDNQ